MDLVNKDIPIDSPHHFDNITSDYLPVGPGSYKEKYLFLYKKETVSVKESFHYNEGKRGVFNRPPYGVKFSAKETAGKEFVLIPIHTKPDHAVKEIDALVDVVDAAKRKWENNNIMVLGDFNAGSNYVKDKDTKDKNTKDKNTKNKNTKNKNTKDKNTKNKNDWENIRLFTDKSFHWLTKDNVATTLAEKPQTHDRIVVTTEMNQGVKKAVVLNFIKEYVLKEAWRVSDHFPVEVELKPELLENPKIRAREPVEKPDRNPKKAKQIHQNPN